MSEVKNMVCILIVANNGRDNYMVATMRNKKDWQHGCINLPGGKVEKEEVINYEGWMGTKKTKPDFVAAAIREVKEETNLDIDEKYLIEVGSLNPEGFKIVFYVIRMEYSYVMNCIRTWFNDTENRCFVDTIDNILKEKRLINNLRYIIPKSLAVLDGWKDE